LSSGTDPRSIIAPTSFRISKQCCGPATRPVSLGVSLPGVERNAAKALVDEAHQICPYSKATRGNIDVTIKLV
jgi:organic hydroperoxide reductase OsmC/OhrA